MSLTIRLIYFALWFLAILILYFLMGVLPALASGIVFALVFLLITFPARTISLASLFLLFFGGLLILSHVTLVIQFVVKTLFLPPSWSNDGRFWLSVGLAPVSEEILKLAPLVVLLVIWNFTRARATFGATDLMLCGLAIGIGFQLFEDMLVGPAKPVAGSWLFGVPLVPFAEVASARGRPDIVFIGHAASTAFMGLALGWSRYFKTPLRYLPALIVLLCMIWSHALYNGVDEFSRDHWIFWTAPVTWIMPWAFLLSTIATIIFESFILRLRTTPIEQQLARRLPLRLDSGQGLSAMLSQVLAWFKCRNLLKNLAYARIWLRANHADREKIEPQLLGIVTQLENSAARFA